MSQFPQDSGMHLVRSRRFMYVQVPHVVTNLMFPYRERGFTPLVPILWSVDSGGVRREAASKDRGKNVIEYLSLLLVC